MKAAGGIRVAAMLVAGLLLPGPVGFDSPAFAHPQQKSNRTSPPQRGTPSARKSRAATSKPAPRAASQPASQPGTEPAPHETVREAFTRIARLPARQQTDRDLALLAGLDFCMAIGAQAGDHIEKRLDVVGYQALPLSGPLPETPDKPLSAKALRELAQQRRPVNIGDLPAERFGLLTREAAREHFSAVADWMLPEDFALLVEPAELDGWVGHTCCLVIRVRGRTATVIGGNLLAALGP